MVGIIVALVVGKPVGIMLVAWLSTHVGGLKMPKGLRVRDLFPAACACGIGFTVSFLIASLAYKNPELSAEARFGVLLASLVAASLSGVLLSRQSKRYAALDAARKASGDHAEEEPEIEERALLEDGTQSVSMKAFTPEWLAAMKARRQERQSKKGE